MKKIVSLLFLAVAALATPPVIFESAQPFRSEELFQKLDEKGQIRRKVENGWL